MSADMIPNWKDMPDDIAISALCWEDVYTYAYDELGRAPTESEVRDLFDIIQDRMTDAMGEMFSDSLSTIADIAIEELLESKPYDQDSLSDEELLFKKYCHECKEVQETYWELNYCEKNPQGIDIFLEYHGNDDTCEDGYCNPDSSIVENETLNMKYVKNHAVFERCVKCHQYFDSAGPQGTQSKNVCKVHYNFTNTNNEVLSENPKDCIYCKCDSAEKQQDTVQKAEPDVISSDVISSDVADSQQCKNCTGRGWYIGDTNTGTYDEIPCEDCNGTGKK